MTAKASWSRQVPISLQLVPGGVFVNGKTQEEIARIIEKQYEEYILNPQVTVTLDKAASYRYSILGDVLQPGVRLMNRRLTVTEALLPKQVAC